MTRPEDDTDPEAARAASGFAFEAVAIRAARADDARALCDGNVAMALETEDLALAPDVVLRGVEAVLADPAKGFYLVAEVADAVVGQVMVTYEWSDWRAGMQWWIQSLHVVPAFRRHGIWRALHAAVTERARAGGAVGIRLYVAADNVRACAAYAALGMDETIYRVYEQPL